MTAQRAKLENQRAVADRKIEFGLKAIASLAEIEGLWRGLEGRGGESFFTSWLWIGSWLASLRDRIRPLLLTGESGGEICGAAILVPRVRRSFAGTVRELHFNSTGEAEFDSITIEYNGFIGAPQTVQDLWSAFLRWFATQNEFGRLSIPGVRSGAMEADGAGLLANEAVSPAYTCALPHNADIEAILGGLSSNSRQQLRRSTRAWERGGPLRCDRAETVETALTWFEALKQLHIKSWNRRNRNHAFRHPFFEVFHRKIIADGVAAGAVDLLRISAGASLLGYLYNFRHGDHAISYQSGFDENLLENRPGYVAHLLAMEMSTRGGATHYDFLAGDNRLKRSFATERYEMSSWCITRKTFGAHFEHAARWLRGHFRPE